MKKAISRLFGGGRRAKKEQDDFVERKDVYVDKKNKSYSFSTVTTLKSDLNQSRDFFADGPPDHVVDLDDFVDTARCCPANMKWSDFDDVEKLVDGTSAELYYAQYIGQPVIIKMIKEEDEANEYAIAEFDMEHSILEHADHPHIVRFVGAGRDPRKFIVMEYLNEGTLGDFLSHNEKRRKEGREILGPTMDFKEALMKGLQLAEGMEYLHSKCLPGVAIVHRDLKPDNIGIMDGNIKVFDFGLSIAIRERSRATEAYDMTGCTGTM